MRRPVLVMIAFSAAIWSLPVYASAATPRSAASTACAAALKQVYNEGVDADPDGTHLEATMTTCTSKKMWITAVQPYVGTNINKAIVITGNSGAKRRRDVLGVWKAVCAGVPTAPACSH